MTTRRKFIKGVTLGTVAVSSSGLMHAFSSPETKGHNTLATTGERQGNPAGDWSYAFDEKESMLHLSAPSVEIDAHLSFISNEASWTLAEARDGVRDRCSLVDPKGSVQ